MAVNPRLGLVLLRIWLGLFFLYAGGLKLLDGSYARLGETVRTMAADKAIPLARPLLEHIAAQPQILTLLVVGGELLIALSLVSGFFARIASGFGIIMCGLYFVASFRGGGVATPALSLTFIVALVAVIVGGASRPLRRGGNRAG
jgi:uncharacterized membrane protein YphA (DoxX/SURF4 family)